MSSTFSPFAHGYTRRFSRALEIILHMALAAHIGAHLLVRRQLVDVVIVDPLSGFECAHAFDEPGRVTRSSMLAASWQSIQATGWVTNWRASANGIRCEGRGGRRHDDRFLWLRRERQAGQAIGDQVDPEDLNRQQWMGNPQRGARNIVQISPEFVVTA